MKAGRLVGILALLWRKDIMTAPELADHFEVSGQTINRDMFVALGFGDKVTVLEPEFVRAAFLNMQRIGAVCIGRDEYYSRNSRLNKMH